FSSDSSPTTIATLSLHDALPIYNYKIPHEWPEDLLSEVEGIADEVGEEDKKNRIDLRHLDFVTIDGEDAKDFDDAVYCEPLKKGDRKSTRLNSSHVKISYAVFCL